MNQKRELAVEEWDFSSCRVKNEELIACAEWEYPRSVPEYVEGIKECRTEYERFCENNPQGFTFEPIPEGLSFGPDLYRYDQWPGQPFSTLEPSFRAALVGRLWHSYDEHDQPDNQLALTSAIHVGPFKLIDEIIALADAEGIPEVLRKEDLLKVISNGPERQFAAFYINWTNSDEKLRDCFVAWLKRFRPKNVQVRETRGAGNIFAQTRRELNELGAWRLLSSGMTWEEATAETEMTRKEESGDQRPVNTKRSSKVKPLYATKPNWMRAFKAAEARLSIWRRRAR